MDVRVERTARMLIHGCYASRAEKLNSLALGDLVPHANSHVLCLRHVGRVDALVDALLRETLRPFDETAQSDLITALRTLVGSGSDALLMQLVRNYSDLEYVNHNAAFSRAMNRLSLQFLREFALPDGHIDWELLDHCAQGIGMQGRREIPNGVRSE